MVHNKINNTDISFIHYARTLAAFAVVLFHVIGGSYSNDPHANPAYQEIVDLLRMLLQWHVPVFYIITGYIWLNDNKTCNYRSISHSLLRLVIALAVFGLSYALMERIFVSRTLTPMVFVEAVQDVLTGKLWDHMWYMYSIIGLYLLLPIIKPFFSMQSTKNICMGVGIVFLFVRIIPAVFSDLGLSDPFHFPIKRVSFFYLLIGGMLSKFTLNRKSSILFGIGIVAGSLCISLNQLLNWNLSVISDILSSVIAVSVFGFFSGIVPSGTANRGVRAASKCCFGIYLIHPFFINMILKVLHFYPYRFYPLLSIPVMSVFLFIMCWGIVFVLRRIGFVRRYLL